MERTNEGRGIINIFLEKPNQKKYVTFVALGLKILIGNKPGPKPAVVAELLAY